MVVVDVAGGMPAIGAAQLGADPRRMAVVGESAGGNLALTTAIGARDQGLPRPVAIGAIYPVAGTDIETPSYLRYAAARPLNKPMIQWFVRNYTRGPRDLQDPRLDIYRRANLAGLPAVSIPCGVAETPNGATLPLGVQLTGRAFDESTLLRAAGAFEQATSWHSLQPPAIAGT